ncbi:eukaryotic translation initiation factor 4 gamma-like [Lathyrus oleraceus]|uniref:eukaryotic translation initiation factor 4 gamma-like n=1 Tax=Pisum sativum TaxID=3888 RepID=UPI0021CE52A1|nr:eukaryotic translation initiation factor 4 gamma-like [Pisum sativum]
MTYEVFKLKGLFKQVKNDYIREAEERLEACMAKEDEEKSRQEAKEKAILEAEEQARKEAEEKEVVEVAATEAEAKAKADAKEATHITVEEAAKSNEFALTRGESSTYGIAPLVLQILEELQKEQQLVRARLDKQDSVNSNIQNLLTQLLQRMPPPPNP